MDLVAWVVVWVLGACVRTLDLVVAWVVLVLLAPREARAIASWMLASVDKRDRERNG